jgi:hypothetical protein
MRLEMYWDNEFSGKVSRQDIITPWRKPSP